MQDKTKKQPRQLSVSRGCGAVLIWLAIQEAAVGNPNLCMETWCYAWTLLLFSDKNVLSAQCEHRFMFLLLIKSNTLIDRNRKGSRKSGMTINTVMCTVLLLLESFNIFINFLCCFWCRSSVVKWSESWYCKFCKICLDFLPPLLCSLHFQLHKKNEIQVLLPDPGISVNIFKMSCRLWSTLFFFVVVFNSCETKIN